MRKHLLAATALAAAAALPASLAAQTVNGDLSDLGAAVATDTNTDHSSSFGATGQYLQGLYVSSDGTDLYIGLEGNSSFGNPLVVFIDVDAVTGDGSTVPATGGGGGALNGGDMVGSILDLADIDFGFSGNSTDDNSGTDAESYHLDAVDYTGAGNTATYLSFDSHTENTTDTAASTTSSWTTTFGTANVEFAYSDGDTGGSTEGFEIRIPLSLLGAVSTDSVQVFAAFTGGSGFFSSDVLPEVTGQTTNIGVDPDFTGLGGTQATASQSLPVELDSFGVE